ncbi:protein meaA [Rhodovibrio salinarum]|uniref:Protein meaA n=1 Tax=Rhodovibrio salinarum TaxID=1087 RepID=A0A934QHE7_9PROT|nr:protein meaA [Rhodovibrio salinarum]MBK1697073.1 protein meaA [Rhodovibrio salinarum]
MAEQRRSAARAAERGPTGSEKPARDKPWMIRTYGGHSSAKASNELYRKNLAAGQTGLSVAFDLPTQTGYDSDHPLARGEVGKVGVPVRHIGDMETLFEEIPLDQMNTSMTINATAPWLLALYVATAERKGIARDQLSGTVQNDIMKEYLSRGTYVFPPKPSMKLTADVIAFTYDEIPRWNPTNVCSYHLQEAGATPEQELAFALSTAKAVIHAVKDTGQVPDSDLPRVIGRIAFFVNAGMRFITEMCKMRAFVRLWDEITHQEFGVEDPKYRRFRYGMQVNSLGLTEQQPENNVYRILIEMLSVVLSKDARARAVQLPAWNEALGLPRPWDQQWSIRMQQIMAYETDLLEYDDIFRDNPAVESKVDQLCAAARAEIEKIDRMGGAVAAIEQGYMKERLVESNARRVAAIEDGAQTVVGVNAYTTSEPSPLTSGTDGSFLAVDPKEEAAQIESLNQWREARDDTKAQAALDALKEAARAGRNVMEPSIQCAHAGVTTGEWGDALRAIYGEYRAPTGVGKQGGQPAGEQGPKRLADVQARVEEVSERIGRRLKMLVGKPGLDGHSNGAEQIAVRARDSGFEVVYEGIRLTPKQIVGAALEEGVHVVGLSILSGSHVELVQEVMRRMHEQGLSDVPVVVGGIIPESDAETLRAAGVAAIYTPKDYDLTAIMADIVEIVDREGERAA